MAEPGGQSPESVGASSGPMIVILKERISVYRTWMAEAIRAGQEQG
jgi:hypothetical protein